MESKDLHYQIIANRNASDSETSALQDAAAEAEIGNVTVEKTGGITDLGADGAPEVILVLKYAGAVLASGVLAAIGADTWKAVKKFVAITFQKDMRTTSQQKIKRT